MRYGKPAYGYAKAATEESELREALRSGIPVPDYAEATRLAVREEVLGTARARAEQNLISAAIGPMTAARAAHTGGLADRVQ